MDQPEPAPVKAGVERMNRTIKEATVVRYHDDTHDQLRPQTQDTQRAHTPRSHLQSGDA